MSAGREAHLQVATAELVLALAESKHCLGMHLSGWAVGAPALESAVAAAALAQEELGHARVLYALLEELPHPAQPRVVGFLQFPWVRWTQAVAGLVLMDTALTTLLVHLTDSASTGLARRAERMLQEEVFHLEFAEGRVRELAEDPEWRQELEGYVGRLLPEVLAWFDPDGEGLRALVQAGVVRGDPEVWRQAYLGRVAPLLLEVGIRLPHGISWDLARGRWEVPTRIRPTQDPACCPWCGSEEVERIGPFGPQLMAASYLCRRCGSPFQRIRKRGNGKG